MKKYIYLLIIILGILILLFCFWFFYLRYEREHQLIKEGYILVEKIEKFRKENGYLPESLNDINYCGKAGTDELIYIKESEKNYTVSFVMSIDYNKTYYSDTKTWESGFREME